MATTDGSPARGVRSVDGSVPGPVPGFGLRLTLGILTLLLGVLVIARPVNTLVFVAILFGIQLVVLGVVRIALAGSVSGVPSWFKVLSIVLGALTIIAGVICFLRPQASLVILALLLAIGWIADGIIDVVRGFGGDRSGGERALLIVLGVVSVVAGLVVAIFPGPSLVLLAQVAGVALVVIGALTCLSALIGRRHAG